MDLRSLRLFRVICLALLVWCAPGAAAGAPPAEGAMRVYRSPRYELHTDVAEPAAREAIARLDALATAYDDWSAPFARPDAGPLSGAARVPLRVELFADIDAYEAAGGAAGSGGQFDAGQIGEGRLLVFAGPKLDDATWHRLQHEAFHQLAHATFRDDLPPWLAEGLAEYFGEAAYAGDRVVTGLIPPPRLARVRDGIERDAFVGLRDFFETPRAQWNRSLAQPQYDQAWSLVVYLVHGEGGRHAERFEAFLDLCAQGRPAPRAWREAFGDDGITAVERGWRRWWSRLPPAATAERSREATVSTLTSFWGRAAVQGQAIEQWERLAALGGAGQLAFDDRQWLPPTLLARSLDEARRYEADGAAWLIRRVNPTFARDGHGAGGRSRELVLLWHDGTAYRGRFSVQEGRVSDVHVTVERLPDDLLAEFAKLGAALDGGGRTPRGD